MIRKLLFRCLFGCLFLTLAVVGVVATCGALAISQPGFYTAALAAPVDEADAAAALEEMEQKFDAMKLFIALDASDRKRIEAMPEAALKEAKWGDSRAVGGLQIALRTMHNAVGNDPETFSVRLDQRGLDALLSKSLDKQCGSLQAPRVVLNGELIRFAVTLETPMKEVVFSCDFKPARTADSALSFELHAVRIGRLPVPAAGLLKEYMRHNPKLPRQFSLRVDGERPVISINAVPKNAKVVVEELRVEEDALHVTFRRVSEAVIAAR